MREPLSINTVINRQPEKKGDVGDKIMRVIFPDIDLNPELPEEEKTSFYGWVFVSGISEMQLTVTTEPDKNTLFEIKTKDCCPFETLEEWVRGVAQDTRKYMLKDFEKQNGEFYLNVGMKKCD
jgi:hypothetical protein